MQPELPTGSINPDFIGGRADVMCSISEEGTALVGRPLSTGIPKWEGAACVQLGWTVQCTSADETAPEDFKRSAQTVLDTRSKTSGEIMLPPSPIDDTHRSGEGETQRHPVHTARTRPNVKKASLEGEIFGRVGEVRLTTTEPSG